MPFQFTTTQKAILANMIEGRNPNAAGVRFDDVYAKLIEFIEDDPDADVEVVEVFLRGARQVNGAIGNFSGMIRGYTQRQLELRSATVPSASEMEQLLQRASNAIAIAIVNDILNRDPAHPNPTGLLPSINSIATYDASASVVHFFEPFIPAADDTARSQAAGWAGTPFFSHFGDWEMHRLVSAGAANVVDRLDDLRNVVFALDAMQFGQFSQSGASFAASVIDDWHVLLETSDEAFKAFFWSVYNDSRYVTLPEFYAAVQRPTLSARVLSSFASLQAPVLSALFQQMGQLGQGSVLDQIRGAYDGRAHSGTTAETFVNAARAFFSSLSPTTLQSIGAEALTATGAEQFVALALSAQRYRNALRGLSQFVLELPSYEGRDVDLYDAVAGTGSLTQRWIEARASMLELRLRMDAHHAPYNEPFANRLLTFGLGPHLDFRDRRFIDLASGLDLTLDNLDFLGLLDPITTVFGSSGNDVIAGTDGQDQIFGDSGIDTVSGGDDDDYLEGGNGADALDGGAGDDDLIGGSGNDMLTAGTGGDRLDGGEGNDTYIVSPADGLDQVIDSDGVGSIQVERPGQPVHVLGSSALTRAEDNNSVFRDAAGFTYLLNAGDLIVSSPEGAQIRIVGYGDGLTPRLGIDLTSASAPQLPPGATLFNVGAPNQDIPNQDEAWQNARGAYVAYDVDGGGWHSPGVVFHRLDTEIITVATPINDPPNNQYWFARASAGFGDSYITGDNGFNFIVDDEEWHFDDAVPGIFGRYQMGPQMGNDRIDAGDGNDWVLTRGGDDTVSGGIGNDRLIDSQSGWEARFQQSTSYLYAWGSTEWVEQPGHTSNDRLFGGAGDDYLAAHGGNQTLAGEGDNDELFGGAGHDILDGGAGNDVLSGDTYLTESPFRSVVDGGGMPIDMLFVGDYLATDVTKYGTDTLSGGIGDDTLYGGGGSDTLYGGADNDRLQGDFLFAYQDLRAGLRNQNTDIPASYGDDQLFGEGGNDELWGGGGDDTLDGGDGADQLYGGQGSDVLQGGGGIDQLVGDYTNEAQGSDTLRGGDGADTLFGMGADDFLYGDAGNDTLTGDNGSDPNLVGDDHLDGGDGDDMLFGNRGNDILIGGAGHDQLQGGDGNDRLAADSGNDVLFGEAGDDTFVLSKGAGQVQITDDQGINRLVFGAGITSNDIRVRRANGLVIIDFSPTDYAFLDVASFNALMDIGFSDEGDMFADVLRHRFEPGTVTDGTLQLSAGVTIGEVSLHARNDDLILAYGGAVQEWIDTSTLAGRNVAFETGDGATYGLAAGTRVLVLTNWYRGSLTEYIRDLRDSSQTVSNFAFAAYSIDRVFEGGGGSDLLHGQATDDALAGGAGSDLLEGGDGTDTLTGGAGPDFLSGGNDNDSYQFSVGDGQDSLFDESGPNDVLRFGPGITAQNLTVTENAEGLHVQVGPAANGDGVSILRWSAGGAQSIDSFVFADGTALTRDAIDALNTGNHSPRVNQTVGEQRARPGLPFLFTIPTTTFSDLDADALTVEASLADGAPLPSWLAYDQGTRTFSATPQQSEIGGYDIELTATDPSGLSVVTAFRIVVPVTVIGTSGDDTLFAPSTGADVLGLTGNDSLWGGNSGDFLVGDEGADYVIGNAGNDVLLGGTGDDTLSGDSGDDTLTGGPGADYLSLGDGDDEVTLDLGDGGDTLDIISDGGTPNGFDTVRFGAGIERTFVISNATVQLVGPNSFQDYYVLRLRYNPTDSSDYLDVKLSHDTSDAEVGSTAQEVLPQLTLEFASGESVNTRQLFDALNVASAGDDVLFQTSTLLNVDGHGGNDLIYGTLGLVGTLSGGTGDDVLQAGEGNQTLDGGEGNDILLTGEGNDTLDGGAGNDQLDGRQGNNILNGGAGDDIFASLAIGANTIADSDGADVAHLGSMYLANPNLRFERQGNDLRLYSTLGSGYSTRVVDWFVSGVHQIEEFRFAEGRFSAAQIEGLALGVNTAPGVNLPLDDRSVFYEDAFSFAIPGDALLDTQPGAGLTYSATSTDGSALPAWLAFDPVTRTFSGTAPASALGAVALRLTATDPGGLSGSDDFVLTIRDPHEPYLGTAANDYLAGTSHDNIIYGLDGDDLLYGFDGNDSLYGGPGRDNLTGGAGADFLDGGPGSDTFGADDMIGGAGDDIFIVDHASDRTRESANQGFDEVRASVSFTLEAEVERLALTGGEAINGTGNALANTLLGNDAANILDGLSGADQMTGEGGDDIYVIDQTGDAVTETDGEGLDEVRASISYVLPTAVENLTLMGFASVNGTGNSSANVLRGNSGHNVLDGGTGADTLIGGGGNDTYIVDDSGDLILENPGAGTDTVQSSVSVVLSADVDNLVLLGTAHIDGTGNVLSNSVTGNSGNNLIDGGGGTDTMLGGAGNDTYIVDTTGETVTENAGEGTDTVQSSVTYTLGNNLENLTLSGTTAINATGNSLDNVLTGNGASNVLSGGGGNDTLDGGVGNDTLTGGLGNDIFIVDSTGDLVNESSGQGTDTVRSFVSWTLGSNLEKLELLGSANVNGTGNTLANTLTGNSGNNTLSGGSGADTMIGGAGDDSYVVDNTGDVITENAAQGTDSVQSSVTYTLATNVENLTLAGSSALSGTGNALDNVLTGNSGANTLTGNAGNDTLDGGAGNDTMRGGQGDDTYYVNATSDVTTENANEGTDTTISGVTRTLGSNLENLTLTGSSAINATGNTLNNTLTGNSGANTLSGVAGSDVLEGKNGNDMMTGGDGADIYRYNAGDGTDTINNSSGDSSTDRLVFIDLARTQLSFARTGNDLVISRVGTPSDSVRVTAWFSATGNRIDVVETTGGQTTTADEIDALIGGGGGSFPNSIAPPEYLMARPSVGFEVAGAMDAADSAELIDSPMRRNHLPVGGLRRPMTAAGLSGEPSGLFRRFDMLQTLVEQPRTLWDGMELGASDGSAPLTCTVLESPKLIACVPLEQPPLKEPRINHMIGATFERFVSAIAAFDDVADSIEISTHTVEALGESVTGIEARLDSAPARVAHRAVTEGFHTQLS